MTITTLHLLDFRAIEGWDEDDHAAAFAAFRISAMSVLATPPKTRAFGIDGGSVPRVALLAVQEAVTPHRDVARKFFERHFVPHRISAEGFVTGYYEPEVAASRIRTARFGVPLYRRPDDLLEISDANRPRGWDLGTRFGRATENGIVPYFDRGAIEDGALEGRGLEIAWVEDPVDAFFIHVQGSARLAFADGATMRIAFDGKSGHSYTSIGRLAVERGLLARENADKDGLESWLRSNAEVGRALMRENRSFIFFRETEQALDEGPIGAAGVPLTALRSLAVDRALHTFHVPVWVDAPSLADPESRERKFRRLLIAQDTGSAIVGPARGDIFFGSGAEAGSAAGRVRHGATMTLLVPAVPEDDR